MHEDLETALDKDRFNEARNVYEYPESDFDEDEPALGKRTERTLKKEEDKKDKKLNKKLLITGMYCRRFIITFNIYFLYISKVYF
ncbi:MAG: hypothetical protein V8R01_05340 [Bacilli bacterium]